MKLRCTSRLTIRSCVALLFVGYVCVVLAFYYGIQRTGQRDKHHAVRANPLPVESQRGDGLAVDTELPLYIKQRSARFSPKWRAMNEQHMQYNRGVRRSTVQRVNGSGSQERKPHFAEVVKGKLFVFSAYFDDRPNDFDNKHNGSFIRMMAVVRGRVKRPNVICEFGNGRRSEKRTEASFYEMCENHGRLFGGFIISCPVPSGVIDQANSIAVLEEGSDSVAHNVTVLPLRPLENRDLFRICVPPLFGKVSSESIVQFVEVSRLLGADRILFYKYNTADETAETLRYYQDKGYVDVIPWEYPDVLEKDSWYHGQLIAIQDCLYRNMRDSEFLLFNDIDEYVVPHGVESWAHLVRDHLQRDQCAFQFNSAFFPDVGPNGTAILAATRRTRHFSRMRTKCMVKPYLIYEQGIHHVSKPIWAWLKVERVPEDLAYLHHYRTCTGTFDMNCRDYTNDNTLQKYANNISVNINKTVHQLRNRNIYFPM